MSWNKFFSGFIGAMKMDKPEERNAALDKLQVPEDPAPPTPNPVKDNAPAPASGISLKGNETPSELVEIIKAQNEVIKNISTDVASMKKAQEEQSAALSNQAKKQLETKVTEAIEKAKREGRIAAKDDKAVAFWKSQLENNFDGSSEILNSLPAKQKTEVTANAQVQSAVQGQPVTGINAMDGYRKAAQEAFAAATNN